MVKAWGGGCRLLVGGCRRMKGGGRGRFRREASNSRSMSSFSGLGVGGDGLEVTVQRFGVKVSGLRDG